MYMYTYIHIIRCLSVSLLYVRVDLNVMYIVIDQSVYVVCMSVSELQRLDWVLPQPIIAL